MTILIHLSHCPNTESWINLDSKRRIPSADDFNMKLTWNIINGAMHCLNNFCYHFTKQKCRLAIQFRKLISQWRINKMFSLIIFLKAFDIMYYLVWRLILSVLLTSNKSHCYGIHLSQAWVDLAFSAEMIGW